MRVVVLNSLLGPDAPSTGLRSATLNVARNLASRGHQITILTAGPPAKWRQDGLDWVAIGQLRPFTGLKELQDPAWITARCKYLWKAAQEVRRINPDVLEVSDGGFEPLFLVVNPPCPLHVRLHGNLSHTRGRHRLNRLIEAVERFVIRRASLITSPSHDYARRCCKTYQIAAQSVRIIPNGIDLEFWQSQASNTDWRERLGIGTAPFALFAGTVTKRKGADVLAALAYRLRGQEAKLVVAGHWEEAPSLESLICVGEISPSLLPSLYDAADLFVLPSEYDNFSMGLVEASASGLASLAFDTGGNREILHDGVTGVLVESGAPEAFLDQALQLLSDRKDCRRLGGAARRRAMVFSIDHVVDILESELITMTQARKH